MRVERKPLELLILLVSREGHLVTRPEIVERLWASDVFVDTDHGINTAIRKLRHLLRDDPESPKFIQTVTGKGYRWVAPVSCVSRDEEETREQPETTVSPTTTGQSEQTAEAPDDLRNVLRPAVRSRTRLYAGTAIAAVVLLAAGFAGLYFARPHLSWKVSYKQITHGGGHKAPA
jgi:DNA-binding winged helix-turn-helix (wHTH) protein